MQTQTIITIVFWSLTAGFLIITYLHGFQKIFAQKQKVEMFTKLGYSIPAMRFIGIVEVVGASFILFPQTRLLVLPIYTVLLSGAVYTHLKSKDDKKEAIGPVIAGAWLAVILVINIWM
jgi:putative oxidoreductase